MSETLNVNICAPELSRIIIKQRLANQLAFCIYAAAYSICVPLFSWLMLLLAGFSFNFSLYLYYFISLSLIWAPYTIYNCFLWANIISTLVRIHDLNENENDNNESLQLWTSNNLHSQCSLWILPGFINNGVLVSGYISNVLGAASRLIRCQNICIATFKIR